MLIFLWLTLVVTAVAFRKNASAWIPMPLSFFVLSLMGDNRGNFVGYVLPVTLLAGVIVAMYYIRKKSYIWGYLLTLPVLAGFMWYHYYYFSGVINPQWPLLMAAVALTVAMFLTGLVSLTWKIIINCSLAAVIVLTMVLALPNYTLSEAKDAIAQDLSETVSHARHQTLKIIPVVPSLSLFVDHEYVFEVVEGGKLTTYSFNPVTGEWSQWYTKPIE